MTVSVFPSTPTTKYVFDFKVFLGLKLYIGNIPFNASSSHQNVPVRLVGLKGSTRHIALNGFFFLKLHYIPAALVFFSWNVFCEPKQIRVFYLGLCSFSIDVDWKTRRHLAGKKRKIVSQNNGSLFYEKDNYFG